MLLKFPLLLRLPPGRPEIKVTPYFLATQNHYNTPCSGLYSCSGSPDLKRSLSVALTFETLTQVKINSKTFATPIIVLKLFQQVHLFVQIV